jgi:hypothetical protein
VPYRASDLPPLRQFEGAIFVPPFQERIFFCPLDLRKGASVEPQLMAEIEYRAKSAEGKVRHPFFRGIREDP